MPNKTVSVIVLNWNGKRFLAKCVSSLLNQTYAQYEVLLVDNGSTDDSLDFVEARFGKSPKLRVIAFKTNYGFSKGNNLAMKLANTDYIIILNNDTEVQCDFIEKLVEVVDINSEVGSVGSKILFNNNKIWFSQKFTNRGFIVPYFLQSLMSKKIEELSHSSTFNLSNSGCAVLYRKKLIDKIGGFDEDFWSNWEDWDLGYRINLAGFKSICIPNPLVYHVGAGSEGSSPERFVRIYRNELFTYFKNYETKNLFFRFPFILFLLQPIYHMVWFVQRILTRSTELYKGRELDYFISQPKALLYFLKQLKNIIKKRYTVQKLRKISDKKIFANTQRDDIL